MLADVLSHVVDFQGCNNWRLAGQLVRHHGAPICIAERFGCNGALTTSFWLLSGLVMGTWSRFEVEENGCNIRFLVVSGAATLTPLGLAGPAHA
jgi:hypothetical protein